MYFLHINTHENTLTFEQKNNTEVLSLMYYFNKYLFWKLFTWQDSLFKNTRFGYLNRSSSSNSSWDIRPNIFHRPVPPLLTLKATFTLSIWASPIKKLRAKYILGNYFLPKFHKNQRLALRDVPLLVKTSRRRYLPRKRLIWENVELT